LATGGGLHSPWYLFDVVEAQPPFGMEVIRGKWMTIPVGRRQFSKDFEPSASYLWSDLGSYRQSKFRDRQLPAGGGGNPLGPRLPLAHRNPQHNIPVTFSHTRQAGHFQSPAPFHLHNRKNTAGSTAPDLNMIALALLPSPTFHLLHPQQVPHAGRP